MKEIIRILDELRQYTGNTQLSLLNSYKNDLLKQVLEYTYNPHKMYKIDELKYNRIALKHKKGNLYNLTIEKWNEFLQFLDYLISIPSAKDEDVYKAVSLIDNCINSAFLKMVLFKDLKLNMSIKKFQKIWNDFCIEPQVQLANMYEGKDFENGFYSRKFDGKRMYILDGLPYSRSNKLCSIPPVQHILDAIPQDLKDKYVFDGECLYFENGIENFQKGISLTSSKERTKECDNIYYVIFDMLPKENFVNKIPYKPFIEELNEMKKVLLPENSCEIFDSLYYTKFPNILLATQQDDKESLTKLQIENNWEGLMYRNANSPYEYKRSKNLLKIKSFYDDEYIIEDIELGKKPMQDNAGIYHEVECVSSIIFTHKGFKVNCGSGISDEQRIAWKDNPSLIIGKTVKIKYFEETINKQNEISLRFPTFLCFRDNMTKEEVI